MNATDTLDENVKYELTEPFKQSIYSLMNNLQDVNYDTRIKIVKSILTIKFNFKASNPKENKIITKLLIDLFDKESVLDVLNARLRRTQKKYYENHKEEIKEKLKERIIKEYEMSKQIK